MDQEHVAIKKAEFAVLAKKIIQLQLPGCRTSLTLPCAGESCPCVMLESILQSIQTAALQLPLTAADFELYELFISLPALYANVLLQKHRKAALCLMADCYYQ
jgi:hypothetical protein